MYEFRFPDVGEGIHEGTIVKWKVKIGDEVKEDQALGEIETAKAVVEIPSPKSGVILKLGAEEGGMIKVGDVLAVIGEKGEKAEETHGRGIGVVGDLPEAPEDTPSETRSLSSSIRPPRESSQAESLNVLPYVRKFAEELKIDLAKIKGTGPGGRITEDDVRKVSPASAKSELPAATPKGTNLSGEAAGRARASGSRGPHEASLSIKKIRKYDMWGYVDHQSLKGMRKTIAEHMVKSISHIPHVTHFDSCDATTLYKHREKEKGKLEKKGIKLTYLPFILKAAIRGLKEFPLLNATLDETNDDIILKKYYNLGVAVDTPEGLMVPVLKGADKKSIIEIAKELQELAEKARSRKIDLMDLQGGSFTVTNVGSIGGTFFTPIINYPEVAILGVASMRDEPRIIGKKLMARKILYIGVTFDHRVVDGATAARFLKKVMEYLEDPNLFLMEYKE